MVRAAATDRDALAGLLDSVAAEAGTGVQDALEDLIWAIHELRLARPAVRLLVVQVVKSLILNHVLRQQDLLSTCEMLQHVIWQERFVAWGVRQRLDLTGVRRDRRPLPFDGRRRQIDGNG